METVNATEIRPNPLKGNFRATKPKNMGKGRTVRELTAPKIHFRVQVEEDKTANTMTITEFKEHGKLYEHLDKVNFELGPVSIEDGERAIAERYGELGIAKE